MLQGHFPQQWLKLPVPLAEEALHDAPVRVPVRCALDNGIDHLPDERAMCCALAKPAAFTRFSGNTAWPSRV